MNKGFSLVELIVVIAIMAILVGVAVPVYSGYITKANNNVDAQLVDEIDRAIETLLIDPDIDTSKIVSVKLANGAFTVEGDTGDTFKDALTAIIAPAALKGDNKGKTVTFTINKYTCTPSYN